MIVAYWLIFALQSKAAVGPKVANVGKVRTADLEASLTESPLCHHSPFLLRFRPFFSSFGEF